MRSGSISRDYAGTTPAFGLGLRAGRRDSRKEATGVELSFVLSNFGAWEPTKLLSILHCNAEPLCSLSFRD